MFSLHPVTAQHEHKKIVFFPIAIRQRNLYRIRAATIVFIQPGWTKHW